MNATKLKPLSVAIGFTLSLSALTAHAIPAPAPETTVEYGGYQYNLTTAYTSYTADSALLESQPWWGDTVLANALMDLVRYDLGDYYGTYPASAGVSALMGYGLVSGSVSISYWDGSLIDCPSGCPGIGGYYAYIIGTQSPLFSLLDVQASLLSTGAGIQAAFTGSALVINGAHSRPMARRVPIGQKTFWVAGDWGKDDHNSRDGDVAMAEFGVGYNYGPVQANLSLGKTWANQNLIQGGELDIDGKYLMLEGIFPVAEDRGIYATLGAYRQWAEADIRRGYLNMGSVEYSSASPDSRAWGLRARIDWEDAFAANSIHFSPYADLTYSKSKLDGYTETGGSFPAQFESRAEGVTELRAGINSAMALGASGFDFIANIEAAHRFDDKAGGTSGEVVGSFSFDLAGEKYDQNWLKAGVGVEGQFASGKASVMLNGTTEGAAPSSWLAASYQMAF